MEFAALISVQKTKLVDLLDRNELVIGEIIYNNGECQILSQSKERFELIVYDSSLTEPIEYAITLDGEDNIFPETKSEFKAWNQYSYACLLQVENELHLLDQKTNNEHQRYTREGMIRRVLAERRLKADKAEYQIEWGKNIYGDHILTNERGMKYRIFLRDFENETGYSDSPDAQKNKLGTTKHIMFAYRKLKEDLTIYAKLSKRFPFIEIYCDPLNDYKITWIYPYELEVQERLIISKYFKNKEFIEENELLNFLGFIEDAENVKRIRIRPEVREKVADAYERKLLVDIESRTTLNYGNIKAQLYEYQKQGVQFVAFKKAAIIADEMGLGKTLQAITAAVKKKEIFGFERTLIVCPASLKQQWKKEIEKFSDEKAVVIQGFPEEREKLYQTASEHFFIVNYETVLRDHVALNKAGIDFLILDEAQRVKNFEAQTNSAVNRLQTKHVLIITGTPIENKLIDIFSIVNILDPHFLGPLWEFSYQHCLFDPEKINKINGYYDLQKLNKKLEHILIRREKRAVLDQLPNVQQINVPVELSDMQREYHSSYAMGIGKIIRKKFLTPYDLKKLQLLLASMRMVCDSTYLIDEETNESPKLDELKNILLEQLDVRNSNRKIIIFSEWVKVHKLIGKVLRDNNIGFAELNGKIPVKSRGELIRKFETNDHCKVFLSTEAGGSGLNLQVADTIINFELPWNPAKKNQRIGRIDRIGQKSSKLTIFNLITRGSIEQQIAAGLLVKQSLFDGVLGTDANINFVDFSSKGRSQFIDQLEEFIVAQEVMPDSDFREVEAMETKIQEDPIENEIDLSEDSSELAEELVDEKIPLAEQPYAPKAEEIEQVMNNGMQFLAGLFKMSTGKDIGMEGQKIEVNKETGEVTMKFKLPGFGG
ncbi:MAG: DEAD/DEAH box helicase [Prolixibacteraceae bacterium]